MTRHHLQGLTPPAGRDGLEDKTERAGPASFGPGDLIFEGEPQTLEELRADLERPAG